jgi:predicted small metal-binding protein
MGRICDCSCGHQLRAASDEELLRAARQHLVAHHPDMARTDEQLRQMISQRARDDVAADAVR